MNPSSPFAQRAAERRAKQDPSSPEQSPDQPSSIQLEQNPFAKRAAERRAQQQPTEYPYENEGDLDREIERHQARATSRGLETIAGLPGDLVSFSKSLFGYDPETSLPTSQSLKKFSEKASGGYTSPKNEFEEKGDEFIQDVASMAIPGSGQYSLMRNIGIPIAATLAKEGIKWMEGSEGVQQGAKIGTMIALDLITHRRNAPGAKGLLGGGAKQHASSLFEEAEKLVPEAAVFDAADLKKSLDLTEKILSKGGSRPSAEKALKKISEIRNEIKGNQANVKDILAYRPAINEIIDDLGGFQLTKSQKNVKNRTVENLQKVKEKIIDFTDKYGKSQNPEFLKLNRSANEAYAVYHKSNHISNFIEKHVSKHIKNPIVKGLLGGAAQTGISTLSPLGVIGSAAGSGAAAGIYQSGKILQRVMSSPTLRKYYGNILSGALKGNASQAIKNAKALEIGLEKESED